MSFKRETKIKNNSAIKHLSLRSISSTTFKAIRTTAPLIKPPTVNLKSFRTLEHPLSNNIYVKGNQTPANFVISLPLKTTSRSTCLIRDAIQSKEWLIKARENIIQELSNYINASNCLKVDCPQVMTTYKYYVGKGNNSLLVKKCLMSRP